MDGHEGQQHEARNGQVQYVDALGTDQRQLHVPCSLQAHEDVQQDRQQDVPTAELAVSTPKIDM